ncbi:MAG: DUF4317 domain-containing protein [Lachnospiraceae bacterium]|jgi:hypothetical protein|nr:DUF4317 domain-containing protein [Lachnospiraceae bacterium]MEE3461917.1 DUF4317 domain-containing protein [Lachnospiraceae bacterium]
MNKKEINEIKGRIKDSKCTFTRLAGCYVSSNKDKIVTFNELYGNLDEEEFHKYLAIAKKVLSGTLDNNLLELKFMETSLISSGDIPMDVIGSGDSEDTETGSESGSRGSKAYNNWKMIMKLRDTGLKDDDALNAFYDHVIETYNITGNYLILLFHDVYDVPVKTKDDIKLDDSEEVYDYIICAICPVDLSKPGLGYNSEDNRIEPLSRNWVVGQVDSGFTFPCFSSRSTDINSILVYTKDPKDPDHDFWENGLSAESRHTSAEKKNAFENIVKANVSEEEQDEILLNVTLGLHNVAEEDEDVSGKNNAPVLDKKRIAPVLEDSGISEDKARIIADKYEEYFEDDAPKASELVDKKSLKSGELTLEKNALKQKVKELHSRLDKYKKSNGEVENYDEEISDIDGDSGVPANDVNKMSTGILSADEESADVVLRVSDEKAGLITETTLDGVRCLVIPLDDDERAMVNGEEYEF